MDEGAAQTGALVTREHRLGVTYVGAVGAAFGLVMAQAVAGPAWSWGAWIRALAIGVVGAAIEAVAEGSLGFVLGPLLGTLAARARARRERAQAAGQLRWWQRPLQGPVVLTIWFVLLLLLTTAEGAGVQLLRFLFWMGAAGSVTYAWVEGARREPPQAARLGALTGLVAGGGATLLIGFVGLATGEGLIYRVVQAAVDWGVLGLAGGMAVDRGWGRRAGVRVGLAVMAATFILTMSRLAFYGSFWPRVLLPQLLVGFLWGLLLLAYPPADRVLSPAPRRAEGMSEGM